jgi:hypothetical protein
MMGNTAVRVAGLEAERRQVSGPPYWRSGRPDSLQAERSDPTVDMRDVVRRSLTRKVDRLQGRVTT